MSQKCLEVFNCNYIGGCCFLNKQFVDVCVSDPGLELLHREIGQRHTEDHHDSGSTTAGESFHAIFTCSK